MEFVCCLLFAAGVWMAISYARSAGHRSTETPSTSDPAHEANRVAVAESGHQPATWSLPPWPVCESLRLTEDWLAAVAAAAHAAERAGAAVPMAEIMTYVDDGRAITAALTRKIDEIHHTRGPEWHSLPHRTQGFLRRDDEWLRRLDHALATLRDDLTDATAAGGWGATEDIQTLDDNVRAIGSALREFTR